MDSWYAVHTQPNGEAKAASNLRCQGFQVYLPSYLKTRRHARKVERVLAPLFPRYLFVCMNIGAVPWRKINSTRGVSGLVGYENTPTILPTKIIDELRRQEDENGVISIDLTRNLRPGDAVSILDGVFAGRPGIFLGYNDDERVQILLELLGRGVRTLVPKSAVSSPN